MGCEWLVLLVPMHVGRPAPWGLYAGGGHGVPYRRLLLKRLCGGGSKKGMFGACTGIKCMLQEACKGRTGTCGQDPGLACGSTAVPSWA